MVASQEVFDNLKALGFNSYQRKLWAALLSNGPSTAGELSDISDVPRSRTYDVLESLSDMGIVRIQTGKPMRYVPVEPEHAFERLKDKHKKDYQEVENKIERLKDSEVFDELDELYKGGVESVDSAELTGALKGRDKMIQQLESMFKNAEDRIYVMVSDAGLKDIHDREMSLVKQAADRGVNVKIVAPLKDGGAKKIASEMSEYAEIKELEDDHVYGRFAVADGKEVTFALTNEDDVHHSQDISFWSKSEHAASNMLEPMFHNYWEKLGSEEKN